MKKIMVGFTIGALATLVLATAADAQRGASGTAQVGVSDRCSWHYALFLDRIIQETSQFGLERHAV
jgi:hypothetical protein